MIVWFFTYCFLLEEICSTLTRIVDIRLELINSLLSATVAFKKQSTDKLNLKMPLAFLLI